MWIKARVVDKRKDVALNLDHFKSAEPADKEDQTALNGPGGEVVKLALAFDKFLKAVDAVSLSQGGVTVTHFYGNGKEGKEVKT